MNVRAWEYKKMKTEIEGDKTALTVYTQKRPMNNLKFVG